MKKTRYTFVTPNLYQACSFDFDPRNPGCLDTVDYHPQTSPLAYYGRVFIAFTLRSKILVCTSSSALGFTNFRSMGRMSFRSFSKTNGHEICGIWTG